ncbi:hypothetical protein BO70DRAFT_426666 [Aspergillus heteromorphus CBS 117.55]|uniref:C-x8-C-x5-C-x3-H type zinc finger protein n=1 Tax=Aspergillus heteromorphus CBS 117.55 TaxID=1448321 RepID=A0A317WRA4_9EURO|nr:uncharacterized protein BO70DRAFT_426666 [Aspergillus heteromorphus CBS 117.55]PWY88989.1 hypothetical protein BO70DRAFT_426666 [Aspergillus heteromorphus CBS 117.55]
MTPPDYLQRYKQLVSIEQDKNLFIEELLQRVTELESAFKQEKLDHERETQFNRNIQLHEMELMEQITRFKAIMDRELFMVVLLDGAGIIFKDEFVLQGEEGGKTAAGMLSAAVKRYVASHFPGLEVKIITKMYVDLKGLSELYVRGGITTDPSLIGEFARGVNSSHPLFDLVDTGAGMDCAHDKIGEAFKLNLFNCHCHQIFLGCSDDSAYYRMLKEAQGEVDLIGRVSLIEGIPFEKDLDAHKASYRVAQFPQIFRNTKITPIWAPWKAAVTSKPPRLPLTPSPSQQNHAAAVPLSLSRSSTNNTSITNASTSISSTSFRPPSPGEFQLVRAKHTTPSSISVLPRVVERNRYGQRVDRLNFKNVPRDEMQSMKKLKLCNLHYLLGECTVDDCQHDHSRKLTKSELLTLMAIARLTPCRFGLECDDPDCTYGHRCPHADPGQRDCHWGSSCRFEPFAHGIDTTIVKTTKV